MTATNFSKPIDDEVGALNSNIATKLGYSNTSINAGATGTISVGGNFRGLLVTNGLGDNVKGIFIISSNSTGISISIIALRTASNVGVSQSGTGDISVTNADGNAVLASLIRMQ